MMSSNTCHGCGKSVKRSGLYAHLRQSHNILCKAFLDELTLGEPSTVFVNGQHQSASGETAAQITPSLPPSTILDVSDVEVDTTGDFFGNYNDYSLEELGIQEDQDIEMDNVAEVGPEAESPNADNLEDADDAAYELLLAEEENSLEPPRTNCIDRNTKLESDAVDPIYAGPALRLRGGAEEILQKRPFIVQFKEGHAGAVYNQGAQNENGHYQEAIGDPENPYAPFRSELEWNIARWAKLRGPSSTAFTELISIDGVSKMP